jgi:hypothetical protein
LQQTAESDVTADINSESFSSSRRAAASHPEEHFMRNPLKLLAAVCCSVFLSAAAIAEGLPAKAAGVTRIGIVQPKVSMAGADSAQSSDAVRGILAQYLQGPTIEVALLGSRLHSQYLIEARQAECDFVLATTLTHRSGSQAGAGRNALGALSNYAPYVPGADYAKTAIATAVLQSAQDFAANIRARDDMQLDVRLESVGGKKPLLEKSTKRKAKSDGEDLLTPLAEGAAEAVGVAIDGGRPHQ